MESSTSASLLLSVLVLELLVVGGFVLVELALLCVVRVVWYAVCVSGIVQYSTCAPLVLAPSPPPPAAPGVRIIIVVVVVVVNVVAVRVTLTPVRV